jgi:hypothetical protein
MLYYKLTRGSEISSGIDPACAASVLRNQGVNDIITRKIVQGN